MTNPAGSPSATATLPSYSASPLGRVGRCAIDFSAYLGGMALLLNAAAVSVVRPRRGEVPVARGVLHELGWMFAMGMPLVAVIHVGLGSFLSMQAYFGGTFVDGTGAVVGVGLIRNIAPLMASHLLGFLLAARMTPEIVTRMRAGDIDAESAAREVGVRLIAAMIAGVVMGIWGAAVGTFVGWVVSGNLMGVSTHSFFRMFWEMLWTLDIIGLLVKGVVFALVTGLCACHEALRLPEEARFPEIAAASCRAACAGALAILVLNSAWFIVFYHARSAFGPTLLKPPTS